MSTSSRRPLAKALELAQRFKQLIASMVTCERFEFAGSLRRRKSDIGDIDAVAMPIFRTFEISDGLFGVKTDRVNALWQRVDELVTLGTFQKAIIHRADGGQQTRWGEKSRAICFEGCTFDVVTADADNFWPWMAVRTGPEPLPRDIVTLIARNGYTLHDGFHVHRDGVLIPNVTEEQFFKMAGLPFRAPESR